MTKDNQEGFIEFDSDDELVTHNFDDSNLPDSDDELDDDFDPETGVLKKEYARYYKNTRDGNLPQQVTDDFVHTVFQQVLTIQRSSLSVNRFSQYQSIYEKTRFLEEVASLKSLIIKAANTTVSFYDPCSNLCSDPCF